MLLNLLDKTAGEARILGLDSVRDALAIKRRIGFVADGQMMYDWMSVDEIIWFCKGFYPAWDDAFAAIANAAGIDRQAEGAPPQPRAAGQAGAAAGDGAYRPELLILDEPTTGLDVVVRRDFLEGIIELIQEEGRTVFFSSHIVHEVERVADWVGIIDKGRLICCSPMEELKASVRRLTLTFAEPPATTPTPAAPAAQRSRRAANGADGVALLRGDAGRRAGAAPDPGGGD